MIGRRSPSRGVRRAAWAICLAAWLAAFMLTHIPADRLPEIPPISDKSLHGSGFFILSLFFLLALALEGVRGFKRVVIVMAVMGVYAALDEITQQFVSRSPALADWCADMIGAGLAVLLWQIAAAIRERSKRAIRQA